MNSEEQNSGKKHQGTSGISDDAEATDKPKKKEEAKKPDLYVIARIISVLKEKGSLNRTTLATSTGLAYNRLAEYLDWMNDREFVTINQEGYVSLTRLGIETYEDLVSWILRYVGRLKFPRID